MSLNKLLVIGNSFCDRYYVDGKYTQSKMGGIHNVSAADKALCLSCCTATIRIDSKNNKKEVECEWGCDCISYRIINETINKLWDVEKNNVCTHIAYLDGMDYFTAAMIHGYKSCDFSFMNPRTDWQQVYRNLAEMDLVFLDYSKIPSLEFHRELEACRALVVSHHEQGGDIHHRGNLLCSFKHEPKSFRNTVGAGDNFAGFFIKSKESFLAHRLEDAHTKTIEWLRSINNVKEL